MLSPFSIAGLRNIAISFIFILLPAYLFPQSDKHAQRASMLVSTLEKYHYSPRSIDDQFSEDLYHDFLQELDPSAIYFTRKETDKLAEWEHKLDDEILGGKNEFIYTAADLFRQRLLLVDSMTAAILASPPDFARTDTIHFRLKNDPTIYSVNDKALQKRWTRWLRYQELTMLYTPANETEDPFTMDQKILLAREPEIRARLAARTKRTIHRLLDQDDLDEYVSTTFLNQLAMQFDPHSSYFTSSGKDEFQSSTSADAYSFGIYVDENNDGAIEITELVPGGSAWKSNQLHKGDVLLGIRPKNGKPLDLNYASSSEAYSMLADITATEADFVIRQANGQVKTVTLVKTKIRSDDNVVKSYILNGEKKIGYISLPSFYTDWETNNPLGCANDVAKEIVKMEEEGIEGLILDLRYNGGGSVREAIGLAGIFVDEGPLCIYKTRNEKPYLLKDLNRGTAYNGPLLVMVNGLSASASELFAAAIQDYHRGVIAGSTTYGKATGQIVIPVDTTFSLPEIMSGKVSNNTESGYLKVTTEKFYRVTDATHQQKGVSPDVRLPEPFYFADYKESSYKNALPADSITKKVVWQPWPALPVEKLAAESAARLLKTNSFAQLNRVNDSLHRLAAQNQPVVLTLKDFRKSEKLSAQLEDEMTDAVSDSSQNYTAVNNIYDQKIVDIDEYTRDINTILLDNIQHDLYLSECYNILRDLIILNKN